MRAARIARGLRHPLRSVRRLVELLAAGPGLPVGRTADTRRLLRRALAGRSQVLVLGPTAAVRQSLPHARLRVVGTSPYDPEVSVVSDARGSGSLPRRWDCVVVTQEDVSAPRLAAASGACLPGGVVAVVHAGSTPEPAVPGAVRVHTATSGRTRVTLVEVGE